MQCHFLSRWVMCFTTLLLKLCIHSVDDYEYLAMKDIFNTFTNMLILKGLKDVIDDYAPE